MFTSRRQAPIEQELRSIIRVSSQVTKNALDCIRHCLRQRLERADRSLKQNTAKFAAFRITTCKSHAEVAIAYRTILAFPHRSGGHDLPEVRHNGLNECQGLRIGSVLYKFSSEVLPHTEQNYFTLFI